MYKLITQVLQEVQDNVCRRSVSVRPVHKDGPRWQSRVSGTPFRSFSWPNFEIKVKRKGKVVPVL